jgi:nucleoside-diphosphate-sugar epimerase
VSAAGLAVGPDAPHVVDPGTDRAATIANGRIVETFGWRPARSLEDGVRDLLAFLETTDAATGAR